MQIIPAIDIIDGQCVRLTKGEFKTKKVYPPSPLVMAKKFEEQGAVMLHIVDLDAAKTGKPVNQKLIIKTAKAIKIPVEVGGGIRDLKIARVYLNAGVLRIIIGTQALTNSGFVGSLIREFGNSRIMIAVEIKQGKVAVNGWQKMYDKNYVDFAKELKAIDVTEVLFTDVGRDGTLTEPNYKAVKELVGLGINVVAAGGISNLASIGKLKELGAKAAVLGKALYENKISLRDAISLSKPQSNLTKRIVPCLDVKDGKVVKGVRFRNHTVVGDVVDLARRYCKEGADELVFYDITASIDGRIVSTDWVRRVARVINIPFCVAGGIRCVDGARKILQSGADKISVNSPALENPQLINNLASEFGSQCVVVGIDSLEENGDYFVKQYTGDSAKMRSTKWRTFDWATEVQKRGAGEIVLNCINQDGVRGGYDIKQLKKLSELVNIPVIASGGAGSLKDFCDVFALAEVDGALAASVFHNRLISILKLKNYLAAKSIPIRI